MLFILFWNSTISCLWPHSLIYLRSKSIPDTEIVDVQDTSNLARCLTAFLLVDTSESNFTSTTFIFDPDPLGLLDFLLRNSECKV